MRLGKEVAAKEILEKAFIADRSTSASATRSRCSIISHKYETLKTGAFPLRFDPEERHGPGQLHGASISKTSTRSWRRSSSISPKGPILIEVFNKHEMFSGRVVALPDLHTIGACTGRMVAMVSPRDKSGSSRKPFNWNRVIRHELVHIFNLEQTNFRCRTGSPKAWR